MTSGAQGSAQTTRGLVRFILDTLYGVAVRNPNSAHAAGWRLTEMEEGVIDDAWIAAKPKWADKRDRPISFARVWEKP